MSARCAGIFLLFGMNNAQVRSFSKEDMVSDGDDVRLF